MSDQEQAERLMRLTDGDQDWVVGSGERLSGGLLVGLEISGAKLEMRGDQVYVRGRREPHYMEGLQQELEEEREATEAAQEQYELVGEDLWLLHDAITQALEVRWGLTIEELTRSVEALRRAHAKGEDVWPHAADVLRAAIGLAGGKP